MADVWRGRSWWRRLARTWGNRGRRLLRETLGWLRRGLHRPAAHLARGRAGERLAASVLRRAGFRVVARNWHCRGGEIDLVAWDGPTLVFVEVRGTAADALVRGAQTITRRKRRRWRRAAQAYLRGLRPRPHCYRFDIVEVFWAGSGTPTWRHQRQVTV